MTTFVLVHGAWHGGWCWTRVAKHLRSRGHDVHAPSLTGLAERSHLTNPGINHQAHILDVLNLLHYEELSGVALCGHSYGGMVITGVADRAPDRIKTPAYLDAFVPQNGQSMLDATLPERRVMLLDRVDHESGGWLVKPASAAAHKVNAVDQNWVDRLCVSHPLACFEQKLVLKDLEDRIRRVFIEATVFSPSPFTPLAARLRMDQRWVVESIACGHDAMVDMPQEVAEALLREA